MRRFVVALVLLAVGLAGCGGDASNPAEPSGATDSGPQHVHGLGINPRDGALVIATHTGLFRALPGERRARRVGDLYQDTMGFTVIGPDEFLGSGHPDARADLPPLLGLIRSEDGGRTWKSISLLGEADFHVLRAAGRQVYGFDSTQARLLVSGDGGREWVERTPPEPLLDLAVDPRRARHVVASSERGLFSSGDAGRRWRPLSRNRAGLLAWTDALYLTDADGRVHRSDDAGRSWTAVGSVDGQPAALASHRGELYVALHDGTVRRSTDGGRTWRVRVAG
jgi:photosystem II stability/assembly factor-like uncharacterized protein